jgi:hypothetical protein
MTDHKKTGTELAVRNPDAIISPITDAKNVRLLAADLFNSRLFRGVESIPHAIAAIQCGAELGIPPVASLNQIKIIKGQMTLSARVLLALATTKAGVKWRVVESTDKRCEIVFTRPGWQDVTSIFTIEEAKLAGLVKDDSGWQKFPQDMLFARCSSRGVRRIAPDTTMGLYATEEIQDADIVDDEKKSDDIFPEAGPVEHPKDEPAKKEPEKKPEPAPGDDISDMAETSEDTDAMEGKDAEIEAAITKIKDKLAAAEIDAKKFKEWLFSYQNKLRPVKAYLGKIGKSYRFHLGKRKDILQLAEMIDAAITTYNSGMTSAGKPSA